MENTLLEKIKQHFKGKSFGELKTLAIENDKWLLHNLLADESFKEKFFTQIEDAFVFHKDRFLEELDSEYRSYGFTKYANKIGLRDKLKGLNKLLSTQGEVVLNFAYKDCVLKGGQSKDTAKSQEIFFNEIIAKDEIDVLFSKKALCDFELIRERERERTLLTLKKF